MIQENEEKKEKKLFVIRVCSRQRFLDKLRPSSIFANRDERPYDSVKAATAVVGGLTDVISVDRFLRLISPFFFRCIVPFNWPGKS